MRTGKYSLNAIERAREEENVRGRGAQRKRKKSENPASQSFNLSTAMHASRNLFSSSLQMAMQDLQSTDLYYSGHGLKLKSEMDMLALKDYVMSRLHLDPVRYRQNEVIVSGLMTPEGYYSIRIQPLLRHLEKHEDSLRLITRMLQVSSMLFSSAAVVLGAAGEITAIPAIISAATVLFQFLKVNDYERRFEITSAACRQLRAVDAKWRSLSNLDHQMRSSIVDVVTTCEQLAAQFTTTSAIQIDKAEVGLEEGPRTYRLSNPTPSIEFGR